MTVELDAIRAELITPTTADSSDWEQIRSELEHVTGEQTFAIWLAPLELLATDRSGALLLACPPLTRAWVAERFERVLEQAGRAVGRELRLATERELQMVDALVAAPGSTLTESFLTDRLSHDQKETSTITPTIHHAVRKDEHVDRRVDAQIDSDKDDPASSGRTGTAFVIVLANHKGGVTKTTSTANLGAMLAEAGRRVLIVDCDPQANLSEAFGWTDELPGERLEDPLAHPEAAARYTPPPALQPDVAPDLAWRERLRIMACTDALADVAADLPSNAGDGYENRLREVLAPLRSGFDLVLLDTPPGLGNLSGMAVLAADGLLIPALAADLDVRGAGKLYDLVEGEVPGLRILGVPIAASERRWRVTRDVAARMNADQMRVLPVQLPRAVRVASAPRYRAPTAVLEPESMVSHAYRQLAHHLLEELDR